MKFKFESTKQIERIKSKEDLITSSPADLVEFLDVLEKENKLESFFKNAVEDKDLLALLSYWEKWFSGKKINLFERIFREYRIEHPADQTELPLGLEDEYSEDELKLIFSNLGALQLSYGCSQGCKFCAFDALPGVREQMPFKHIRAILERYGGILPTGIRGSGQSKALFYHASDLLDYKFTENGELRTFVDVYKLVNDLTGSPPYLSTRVEGDKEWEDFLGKLPEKEIRRSTLTNKNASRGWGKDFKKEGGNVGSQSIGCYDGTLLSPRGLYNVVQVPVSEKYPQGQIVTPIGSLDESEVSIGQDLSSVLRHCVVRNRPLSNNFFGAYGSTSKVNNKMRFEKIKNEWENYEDIELISNDKVIYVKVDYDMKVIRISESSDFLNRLNELSKKIFEFRQKCFSNIEYIKSEEFMKRRQDLAESLIRFRRFRRYGVNDAVYGRLEESQAVVGELYDLEKQNSLT